MPAEELPLLTGSLSKSSANPNSCVREIQNMSSEEFARLKSNVTINMIRINLETLANLEKTLQEKRNQLSHHQKVVNSQ